MDARRWLATVAHRNDWAEVAMKRLTDRLRILESRQDESLSMLPGLVLMPSQNHDAEHAKFIATHGRPPSIVVVIKRVSARVNPLNDE